MTPWGGGLCNLLRACVCARVYACAVICWLISDSLCWVCCVFIVCRLRNSSGAIAVAWAPAGRQSSGLQRLQDAAFRVQQQNQNRKAEGPSLKVSPQDEANLRVMLKRGMLTPEHAAAQPSGPPANQHKLILGGGAFMGCTGVPKPHPHPGGWVQPPPSSTRPPECHF